MHTLNIHGAIIVAREQANRDPQTAAGILRAYDEIEDAGLGDLAYLLEHGEYGCHKNDVIGLIELLENG